MNLGKRIAVVAVLAALVAGCAPAAGSPTPPTGAAAGVEAAVANPGAGTGLPPELGETPTRVTLVSGDVVTVRRVGGQVVTDVEPAPGREQVTFSIDEHGGRLEVVPSDAVALLGAGRLDRRLFDVAGLVAAGYHDAARPDVPLLVVPEAADQPVAAATTLAAEGGEVTELPAVRATAVSQPKNRAAALWDRIVPGGQGEPGQRSLEAGIGTVWLDGLRHTALDHSAAQVGAPTAWDAGFTGAGVPVAVLDTGIDATHPDVAGRIVEARNFAPGLDADDRAGHGTHVASIVAGTGARSEGRYRGVAPDASLLAGRVCDDEGWCAESDILAGMAWATDAGARIVNLSVGSWDDPTVVDPLEAAVDDLSGRHGTLFVVAAGNTGDYPPPYDKVSSPASADAALAVGAVDDADRVADFSSRGPRAGDGALKPEITAPGVGIVAARAANGSSGTPVEDGYVSGDGTSMAAPHVAGAAAILAQQHPDWNGDRIRGHLVGAATPVAGAGPEEQGAGRLDVGRAVAQAVSAEPAVLSAGRASWPHDDDEPVVRTVTYHNSGTETVTLGLDIQATGADGDEPAPDMFTLAADEVAVPAGGTAAVDITVDTSVEAAPGVHGAHITATAGDTVVTTPVVVELEAESYDLTMEVIDRDGAPATSHQTDIFGLDHPVFESGDESTFTVRLPAGRYVATSSVFPPDGSTLSRLTAPGVDLDRDQTLRMDAREAAPVEVTVQGRDVRFGGGMFGNIILGDQGWGTEVALAIPEGYLERFYVGHVGPEVGQDTMTATIQGLWYEPPPSGNPEEADQLYRLAWFEHGRSFTGLAEQVGDAELATIQVTNRQADPGTVGNHFEYGEPRERDGMLLTSFSLPFDLPMHRTVRYSTDDVEWIGELEIVHPDPDGGSVEPVSRHESRRRSFRPGQTLEETWNRAVFGPTVWDPSRPVNYAPLLRSGDTIGVEISMHGDADGRAGGSPLDTGRTTLHRNGEIVGEWDSPGCCAFDVPPEEGTYRLEVERARPPTARLSTRTTAAWTFRSAHVDGEEPTPLPMLAVRMAPPLDDLNQAPAGTTIEVPVTIDRQGDVGRVGRPTIEASFDDGATWTEVPVRRARHGRGYVAVVEHPSSGEYVSLRAHAADRRGNEVELTTLRAYALTPVA